jgi:ectoine hydroxylase-related dioxygenase (phytanoyl-CoA dioxygenase family)
MVHAYSLESPDSIAFARDGYIVPDRRVSDVLLRDMQESLLRLIVENPHVRPEHLVLRWGGAEQALPTHQKFLQFVRAPEILDVVERVLGADIICWGAHVFCKPAGTGLAVPWHQDGQYWPIRPLASCTVWVALDDSTVENGCLRIVRGSHRMKTIYHHRLEERADYALEQHIDESEFDESQIVDVELQAGQMSIHDVYAIHGSRVNQSSKRRAGFAIRYMPATSLYDRTIKMAGAARGLRQDMSKRPIYLVRGRDRAGNDFECGHDRPFEVGVAE